MGVIGIMSGYNGSRTRGTKKVENHWNMQICCFKKNISCDMIYVKKYLNA